MTTQPDPFPRLASQKTQSPDLQNLFQELMQRAETFARMNDEFTESIAVHREAREGRRVALTKAQQRTIANFTRDALEEELKMEKRIATLNDAALLSIAWSGAHQQIQGDERWYKYFPEEDQVMAQKILNFHRETKNLIEKFIEISPLKDKVKLI